MNLEIVLPCIALSLIAFGLWNGWNKRCKAKSGWVDHCNHSLYFNKADPHGPHAGEEDGWVQRLVSKCCYCGEIESGWDLSEFNPKTTPTYDTKQAAKWKAGLEDER